MNSVVGSIAHELSVGLTQVEAAVRLLDEGATVPFIARYRKEATGGLDDTQLRHLEQRLSYLRELEERRAVVRRSIEEQGKLTAALALALEQAQTKTRLEDLYLPFKPKRRSRAQMAREAGLAPLARELLADPRRVPEQAAAAYVSAEKQVADAQAALEGARHVLIEDLAQDADLLGRLREYVWDNAFITSQVVAEREKEGAKFSDYFQHREPLKGVPSHRALALLRGRNEGVLQVGLSLVDVDGKDRNAVCESLVARHFGIRDEGRPADAWLMDAVRLAWRAKLLTHLTGELMSRLREAAESAAIEVFAANLRDLLLAAPAGPRCIMGLDPGLRTGVKVAVVDLTGKLMATATVYPHAPRNEWEETQHTLAGLCKRHGVELIAVGNGTASRETDRLVADLLKTHPELHVRKAMVSEAGASVYSASELAAAEFPELDVALRGAVSIARRLQDPLAELVKIDPKSIGVGQYQHDVTQTRLARTLDAVVEDCVNAVGVEVNTASAALLARVAGLGPGLARSIVQYRDAHGPFPDRQAFRQVPRLGGKTFEQAAGFLRIVGGANPLDASAVHPEAYPVVERILEATARDIRSLIGDTALLQTLTPAQFTDRRFGVPTVTDILRELEKPGRDPRPEFHTATFREGVEGLGDLAPGMVLEGVVTNVTGFGAFVDIGVHQDGLVHISALAERFVRDPREVVQAGDVVKVKVLEVDVARQRIALTMRLGDAVGRSPLKRRDDSAKGRPGKPGGPAAPVQGALAEAFARARKRR